MDLALKALLAYLIGSVSGSLLVGRARGGVDIRTVGSGNAGGTNALRTQGAIFAFWVMVIDVGKGWIAAALIPTLPVSGSPAANAAALAAWTPAACAFAAVFGHVLPIWHGFRGGKGVATLVGALLGLAPILFLCVLLVWFVWVVAFGYVGLASIIATSAVPFAAFALRLQPIAPLVAFGVACSAFIAFSHRSNVARMRAGTEPRAQRLWWFGMRGRK